MMDPEIAKNFMLSDSEYSELLRLFGPSEALEQLRKENRK